MAGHNQHYIPQFLLRGFGIAGPRRPTHVWAFRMGVAPRRKAIRGWASEDDFNSEAAADDAPTLDDRITDEENRIARHVQNLRSASPGEPVDASIAAQVVNHLAPRTSHLRATFARALTQLADGAAETFGDPKTLERLIGIDVGRPSARITAHIKESLEENPAFKLLGLPDPLLEKLIFQFAREQFGALSENILPAIDGITSQLRDSAEPGAREGHVKALAALNDESPRFTELTRLAWSIVEAPAEGAALPDCVALSFDKARAVSPYMLSERDSLASVVLPLSSTRLLLGVREGCEFPNLDTINQAAAQCSRAFFVAATDEPALAALSDAIGERANSIVDEALEGVFRQYRATLPDGKPEATEAASADPIAPEAASTSPFQYEVSFLDCASDEAAREIAAQVKVIVDAVGRWLPLTRLEGVTFAADYPAAVRSVDRGVAGMAPAETVDEEIGVGIAMAVDVVRDGVVKTRLVMAGGVGHALIGDEEGLCRWAVYTLVHELALVALVHHIDTALPGRLLRPMDGSVSNAGLYACVHSALEAYYAARESAVFAPSDETRDAYEQLAFEALERAERVVIDARRSYRHHGDLDEFVRVLMPATRHILEALAKVLGHRDGRNEPVPDADSSLGQALARHSLLPWMELFRSDLTAFADRAGLWQSFDEFTRFIQHAERIWWVFGAFPWLNEHGQERIEVPVATDAEWLLNANLANLQRLLTGEPVAG